MSFRDLTTSGALPALTAGLQFAARRHEVIAHNIANLGTPDFQPLDVSVKGFQRSLAEAIDRRRAATGGTRGDLPWRDTREVRMTDLGAIALSPEESGRALLRHDRNNSDLDLSMQDLAENTAFFRLSADLLKSRMRLLESAVSERV